ncbi:putative VanZ family protein [Magnetofaba australis IT-1]|uniref:Putative VanZ family protein n=1 Tax=Magnetofaba australis IT-1 TaxID=1434232 RepID=A0A1Y2K518_9PROT|nr:putative VanZ family protein [Magnetofaba australis IT-1]
MLITALLSGVIFHLSSGPITAPMPPIPHIDKAIHASIYALLAISAALCARHLFTALTRPEWWGALYAALYGASDEWHQTFVPSRYADIWDWLADVAGAILAVWALKKYGKLKETGASPQTP